ncbi:MAG: hypothetical protein LBT48_01030 [Prevotellaceae bacterium]|jgi:hypothetical protein|nr:hypothetical protein [Prevotellaceae bacterium]
MVFISRQAKLDLDNIVIGLLEWDKISLTIPEVMQYVDDIVDICYQLHTLHYHHKATYNEHVTYGAYSYLYKRTRNTIWYIIYDIDAMDNIFVNKIISNYMTRS